VCSLVLECPEGAGPGDTLEVEWEGREIEIEIPAGVSVGQEFEVAIAMGARHIPPAV
jgi:hypothetical protein